MILEYEDKLPEIDPSVFIASNASVIGDVKIGKDANIWYSCVLRGDINSIRVGKNTNIQDGVVCHVDQGEYSLQIGENVTVGHNVVLHGCIIDDNCLIGMGAIVLTGAKIGTNCIIGAGTLVTEKKVIPPGSLVLGMPGKVVRKVSEEEKKVILNSSIHYIGLAKLHIKAQAG